MRSTAVGEGAVATGERSLLFGNFATATAINENQFALGNPQNTYASPGINLADSTAAQGPVVDCPTTDAAGNLAVDTSALPTAALTSAVQANAGSIAAKSVEIASNARGISSNKEGIATAMALDTPYVSSGRTFALSTGVGAFEGKTAFALNMVCRASDTAQFEAGLAHGFEGTRPVAVSG